MGRPPCCDKVGIKKGPWIPEEDIILISYIQEHGPGNWRSVPTNTGLSRCSKSCRLRWTNYLRPGIKRGNFTSHEEVMIIHLQSLFGNKWAAIASYLPQRTDNDIKNYWNTHLKKKLSKFQSVLEVPLRMVQGSSITTCQIVSKNLNDRRSCLDFGALSNSTANLKLNQTTSTYASSTENISRLLESWMMRSSPPKTVILKEEIAAQQEQQWNQSNSFDNNDSIGSCSSAAAAAANSLQEGYYYYRSKDEKEGGDLISNEEFESILSFENMNNVAWDESSGQVEEMNQMMELSSIF